MRHISLFFIAVLIMSGSVSAMSDKRMKRGGSCTEWCTLDGEKVKSNPIKDEDTYDRFCTMRGLTPMKLGWMPGVWSKREVLLEFNSENSKTAGSLGWCTAACKDKKGGLYTKLFNKDRVKDVEKFIEERTKECAEWKNKLGRNVRY